MKVEQRLLILLHFEAAGLPWTRRDLARRLAVPLVRVRTALRALERAGDVARVGHGWDLA